MIIGVAIPALADVPRANHHCHSFFGQQSTIPGPPDRKAPLKQLCRRPFFSIGTAVSSGVAFPALRPVRKRHAQIFFVFHQQYAASVMIKNPGFGAGRFVRRRPLRFLPALAFPAAYRKNELLKGASLAQVALGRNASSHGPPQWVRASGSPQNQLPLNAGLTYGWTSVERLKRCA